MKRCLQVMTIVLVVLGFGSVLSAQMQGELSLASLRVGLWPEYDRSALLVIYWGELAESTTYPATVSFRIPSSVAAPHVVAAQPESGANVDEVGYESEIFGDWRVITFETNGPRFQLEYYDSLERNGDTRSPGFVWPGDYDVAVFSVELQQPPHSQNLTTSPSLASSGVNPDDNLTYFGAQYSGFAAGEEYRLEISYTRDTDELTAALLSALQSQGQVVAGGNTAVIAQTGDSGGEIDVILLAVVAVVFFLLGAAVMRIAINIQMLNQQNRKR